MVSIKPIQDRIYRSRLTITYRTNIDGQLVPATLPFRLLVLGNFTREGTKAAHLEDRSIVTITRGTNLEDVMRDMGVRLGVPAGPGHQALGKGLAVAGTVKTADGGEPLLGQVDAIDDKGRCALQGTLEFTGVIQQNGDHPVVGELQTAGTAELVATIDPEQLLSLGGICHLPVTTPAAKAPVTAQVTNPSVGKFEITLKDQPLPLESKAVGGAWKQFTATGTLGGTVTPSSATAGQATVKGLLTLTDASGQIPKNKLPRVDATATFAVTAAAGAGGAVTWQITQGAAVDVVVDDVMPFEVTLPSTTKAGDLVGSVAVGKRGYIAVGVKAGAPIPQPDPSTQIKLAVSPANFRVAPVALTSIEGTSAKVAFQLQPDGFDKPFEVTSPIEIKVAAATVHVSVQGQFREVLNDGAPAEEVLAGSAPPGSQTLTNVPIEIGPGGVVAVRVVEDLAKGISYPIMGQRTLAFTSLDSFAPDTVADSIPELRRLGVIKQLLVELKGDLNVSADARVFVADTLRAICDPDYERSGRLPVLDTLRTTYGALDVGDGVGDVTDPLRKLSDDDQAAQQAWFTASFHPISERLFSVLEMPAPKADTWQTNALVVRDGDTLSFHYRDATMADDYTRLQNAMVALILNGTGLDTVGKNDIADKIDAIVARVDVRIRDHLRFVLHDPKFRDLERNWRSVGELCDQVETDQVTIDLLDVSKETLGEDLADHKNDIFTSSLFRKVYVGEYDRYGGKPFGVMLGLFAFGSSDDEVQSWLTTMSQIANAAHCPFVSSVTPAFFGADIKTWGDLDSIGDVEAHLDKPQYGKWNDLRESLEAPYLGLCLPGYLMRKPWVADAEQLGNVSYDLGEIDDDAEDDHDEYLWGYAAVLLAKNLIRSFEQSGWCQYIRGVKGGGLVSGLTVNTIRRHGREEQQSPLDVDIADYRELQFAKGGLIPLIHHKGTAEAAFFSTQSLKKPHDYIKDLDTQNSYLVTNLAYTLSITRIAHYVKAMMRDYIGSSLDAAYIQNTLQLWLDDYVTTTVNPDDLTLRYYPFRAVAVTVQPKPGPLGWFKATVSVLPHIQFEGMDAELRLEAALGAAS